MRIPKGQSFLILGSSLFAMAVWLGVRTEVNPNGKSSRNRLPELHDPTNIPQDSQNRTKSERKLRASEHRKLTVRYEVNYEFLGNLYVKWEEQNAESPQNGIRPRVSVSGLVNAIGIFIEKDEAFRHNSHFNREFIHATMSIADHEAL
jgi:hypothetical protein